MADLKVALLPTRGVVSVCGAETRKFLQGLLTADVSSLAPGDAGFAGLLTPQGKIMFDFFVVAKNEDTFLLDCPGDLTGDLVRRLSLYKLRSKVDVEDVSSAYTVSAAWAQPESDIATGLLRTTDNELIFIDPRLPDLGMRMLLTLGTDFLPGKLIAEAASNKAYAAHRIALGVPEGGSDYAYGDAFPHEALFDQFGGVDFNKGCYVGQEVVSRMQHRQSARKRIVKVTGKRTLPQTGADVRAGSAVIGRLGSVDEENGLALVRTDRVAEALAKAQSIETEGIELTVSTPPWVDFMIPQIENQSQIDSAEK